MTPKIDIIIPSCKQPHILAPLITEVKNFSTGPYNLIIASNPEFSAAQNRNACLMLSSAPYIIMMDDDITGFYTGWNQDMIKPLQLFPKITITSARLIRPDGKLAAMMSSKYRLDQDLEEVTKTPTACVAFRQTTYRFDENFKGSGFEDDAFCLALGPQIVIDNQVRLIHLNEMKRQHENWEHNKKHFEETYVNRTV